MRTCTAGVLTVVVAAALAACSSDAGTEPSAQTTGPDVCASADAFRASLTALGDVQVVQDGTGALEKAWTTVQDDWAQLKDDARAEHSDQVESVQAAADTVQSAVDAAKDQPSAQTLGNAAAAVTVFLQDAGALEDEVSSTC